MSVSTTTPSHEWLMQLAEDLGIDIPPADDDPRSCSHGWGFVLNPYLVDAWLLEALRDVKVTAPEVPDVPNAFRVDGYVNWRALLEAHPDQLGVDDMWTPTSVCLDIVEELRAAGHAASVTVYVDVTGQLEDHRLVYGVVTNCIMVLGDNATAVLRPYEGTLQAALEEPPGTPRPALMLYYDPGSAQWSFD